MSEFNASVESRLRALLQEPRTERLADLDPRASQSGDGLRPAAVLLLLERTPGYSVIFTKRTHEVEHHKGEVSLAGGMRDPGDVDLVATALREAKEELGIEPGDVDVVGTLNELVTVTRFLVTPVVGIIDAGYAMRPEPREVERVLHVPMRVLRDPASWFEEERTWRGKSYRLRSCRHDRDIIWGATSRIVQAFLATVPADIL